MSKEPCTHSEVYRDKCQLCGKLVGWDKGTGKRYRVCVIGRATQTADNATMAIDMEDSSEFGGWLTDWVEYARPVRKLRLARTRVGVSKGGAVITVSTRAEAYRLQEDPNFHSWLTDWLVVDVSYRPEKGEGDA